MINKYIERKYMNILFMNVNKYGLTDRDITVIIL